jgi:hypothetical protein
MRVKKTEATYDDLKNHINEELMRIRLFNKIRIEQLESYHAKQDKKFEGLYSLMEGLKQEDVRIEKQQKDFKGVIEIYVRGLTERIGMAETAMFKVFSKRLEDIADDRENLKLLIREIARSLNDYNKYIGYSDFLGHLLKKTSRNIRLYCASAKLTSKMLDSSESTEWSP